MLGVDIVKISRFEKDYLSLAKRLFSLRELEELTLKRTEKEKVEYVAGRFASKEAFIKAKGEKNISFKEIEILSDSLGKPHIYYNNIEVGEVSISHDEYLVSVVLLK